MNRKAELPIILFALFVVIAGASIIFSSSHSGLLSITGLPIATSTTCGDVNGSLTLAADVSFSSGYCFNVTNSSVVINCAGFKITGDDTTNSAGVFANNPVTNITVMNCFIKDGYYGVFLNNSDNNTIFNNTFTSNTIGVQALSSNYNLVSKNNITANGYGFVGGSGASDQATGNMLDKNRFDHQTTMEMALANTPQTQVTNNTFLTSVTVSYISPNGGELHFINNTVQSSTTILTGEQNYPSILIENNFFNMTSTGYGILMYGASGWNVSNNVAHGSSSASFMYSRDAGGLIARNNTLRGFSVGFLVHYNSAGLRYIDNTLYGMADYGFVAQANSNNHVYINNTINNTPVGFAIVNEDGFGGPSGVNLSSNLFSNVSTTITSSSPFSNTVQDMPIKVTKSSGGSLVSSVDFGIVSEVNISANFSNNEGGVLVTDRAVGVNVTKYPTLNQSSIIILGNNSIESRPALYVFENYTTNRSKVLAEGVLCSASLCSNITYNSVTRRLQFNASSFSVYAAADCSTPENGMNITSNTLFCPGFFNIPDGIRINASNIAVTCNQTIFNGTKSNDAIRILRLTNVTIRGCTILNPVIGIVVGIAENLTLVNNTILSADEYAFSLDSVNRSYVANNRINNSRIGGIFLGTSSSNNTLANNIMFNTSGSGGGFLLQTSSSNNLILDNTIFQTGSNAGINLNAVENITIRGNSITNTFTGIHLEDTSSSIIDNNTYANNTRDIFSLNNANNTLIILNGQNQLTFHRRFINVTDIDNIFINNSVATINISAEPQMNVSAEITFSSQTLLFAPGIFRFENFTTNRSKILAEGSICPSTICTNITYNATAGLLTFNVSGFSSYAASDCVAPSNAMNLSASVTFCPGIFNLANGIKITASNIAVACNQTILNGSGTTNIGVNISNFNNVTIQSCQVQRYNTGIELRNTQNATITNNTIISASASGISLTTSLYGMVSNNNVSNNAGSAAVLLSSAHNNTISGNLLTNISGNSVGLSSSHNNTISSNTITGGLTSIIDLGSSSDFNTITGNNISNIFDAGITVGSSRNNLVSSNIILNSTSDGIDVVSAHNNSIIGNIVANVSAHGIRINDGQNNTITGNSVSNGTNGIRFESAAINTLENNTFALNAIDIFTVAGAGNRNNTLVVSSSSGTIRFTQKFINVTDADNLFVGTRIAAVNSGTERSMNVSAEITLTGLTDSSTPTILRAENFFTSADSAVSAGSACPSDVCTNVTYSSGTLSFNVTHFSSYAVATPSTPPSGGGGSPPSNFITPPSTPVTTPPTTPPATAPVTEQPAAPQTSIDPATVSTNPFACVQTQQAPVDNAVRPVDASRYLTTVKPGYDVLVQPFALACGSEDFSLTLSLPDSYGNITALRCSGSSCNPVPYTEVTTVSCGAQTFIDTKRTSTQLEPELFPIALEKAESKPGAQELTSGRTKLSFIGDATSTVSLDKLFGPAPEAKNPRIKIVGTPTVVRFESKESASSFAITLPYVVTENVDELSTALYARKNNEWIYIGGNVDKKTQTVTANLTNVQELIEDNALTLAPMSLICLNCFEGSLKKVYDGESRDAVILIHGFENTPERFEDIINDIRLTQQPWQVWTYGYPSSRNIDENAKDLADLLQVHENEYDFIYLAGHSLGGLVMQEALHYAYTQNEDKTERPYPFVDKVVKVVSVAAPNKGVVLQQLTSLYNRLVNSDIAAGLFSLNTLVVQDLVKGREIPQVPGIEYLVVAGTRQYELAEYIGVAEINDGLVTLSSAQTIGGKSLTNYCSNLWTINTTHSDLLNNFESRKIIERIVAREIIDTVQDKSIVGHNQYYELEVANCNPNDQFLIIGAPLQPAAQPDPGLCACGNGVCGVDEDSVSCPSDCAVIERPEQSLLSILLRFAPLRNLLIMLLVITIGITFLVTRRKHTGYAPTVTVPKIELPHVSLKLPQFRREKSIIPRTPEPSAPAVQKSEIKIPEKLSESASEPQMEKQLNELLVKTRIAMRLGEKDSAVFAYSRFEEEYATASARLKESFKDLREQLKKELRGRL